MFNVQTKINFSPKKTIFRKHISFDSLSLSISAIDIESLQNRLFKVCYVPATTPIFQGIFFAAAMNSFNKANKAGGVCH